MKTITAGTLRLNLSVTSQNVMLQQSAKQRKRDMKLEELKREHRMEKPRELVGPQVMENEAGFISKYTGGFDN